MPNTRVSSPPPPKDDPRFDDWMREFYRRGNSGESYTQAITAARTIAAEEADYTFTNEGATARVDFTLPAAARGLRYTFKCNDTDGIRVIAAGTNKIRNAATLSAAGGRVDSTTIGSAITLQALNESEWWVIAIVGTWTVT